MKIAITVVLAGISTISEAYETPLHARITQEAFGKSILSIDQSAIFARLGFDRFSIDHPFEHVTTEICTDGVQASLDAYADPVGEWLSDGIPPDDANVRFRCPQLYERRLMPLNFSGRNTNASLGPTPQLRFEAWLMRGAIREDDIGRSNYANPELAPDADPWGDSIRVLNHFYSPVTNTADVPVLSGALVWAFGEANPFATPAIPDQERENHFSVADARRNYFLAMTYKAFAVFPSEEAARQDDATRLSLWASTLNALGHVVHLLQDQASPQHSRGEAHNHTCTGMSSFINQDIATRTYENYTNFRLLFVDNQNLTRSSLETYESTNGCEEQSWLTMFARQQPDGPPDPSGWFASNYPVPQFPLTRGFFTTRAATDGTSAAGIPLAQLNQRAGLGFMPIVDFSLRITRRDVI